MARPRCVRDVEDARRYRQQLHPVGVWKTAGADQWAGSLIATRYDITAKTDPHATKEQMQMMLRTLLSERFKLAFHMEKKEMRVYTLTVAKSGIKMKPSPPGVEMHHENSATGMVAQAITMQELANYLSDPLDAPLTDSTGLMAATISSSTSHRT